MEIHSLGELFKTILDMMKLYVIVQEYGSRTVRRGTVSRKKKPNLTNLTYLT